MTRVRVCSVVCDCCLSSLLLRACVLGRVGVDEVVSVVSDE